MSEEDRLKMLDEFRANKADVENMLNKLPLSMKTMALHKKKDELEEKLKMIEKNIDLFSKKKVYIAM